MTEHPFDQQVVFLYTTDLERSAAFYSAALGLEMVLDQGLCRIFRVAGTAFLGVCHDPEKAGESDGVIVTLVTDLVEERFAHAVAAGAEVVTRPRYNDRFNVFHAFLRDPDGNLLEIQQFRDPSWPRVRPGDE